MLGGTGSYGPYFADGLAATSPTAELNDPRSLAVGPTGALFVSDGFMRVIRVVPASTGTLFGRAMTGGDLYTVAGALPVSTPRGARRRHQVGPHADGDPDGDRAVDVGRPVLRRRRPQFGPGDRVTGDRVMA